ncbi:YdcH family protein [endosymbiont of Ridgeia piscesae]|jgi:uncharacterized protein YdcH (DUF465 family)|uniref:DUF465 domain-containing protein n=1 Tax=endosymbiont of Ridgeia piscesae TaxID=54398 RepID=A0A0T5YXL8_9GAMM|nr:YdcH family protein [endosymbiont of Ridgeia piscesae]KRT55265.1 hypothetical protein Ga0074115_11623 [endosymbiont of Ridgeia piscesae]KRT59021.1 hypothetical protein Ga0076813_14646 [endosymbiont of Ridgeia piscesae]
MLSEHHDIDHEFPEFHERLEAAKAADAEFAALVDKHDVLDDEIRELEERGQPIEDLDIEQMKKQRAQMKDEIFAKLRSA